MIPPTNPPPPCDALQPTLIVRPFSNAAANNVQQYGFLRTYAPFRSLAFLPNVVTESLKTNVRVCAAPLDSQGTFWSYKQGAIPLAIGGWPTQRPLVRAVYVPTQVKRMYSSPLPKGLIDRLYVLFQAMRDQATPFPTISLPAPVFSLNLTTWFLAPWMF